MDYDSWRSSGKRIQLGDRAVFVRSVGQGPPLLFLHGFPTTSYDFDAVIEGLSPLIAA
jgi:pimeloyl-ACP methyl ester carboxylesterase